MPFRSNYKVRYYVREYADGDSSSDADVDNKFAPGQTHRRYLPTINFFIPVYPRVLWLCLPDSVQSVTSPVRLSEPITSHFVRDKVFTRSSKRPALARVF